MAAVASQGADKNEPTQIADPFSASESYERYYSPSSSPNLPGDGDLQVAAKSEEYRQLFRLPPDEVLVQDFNCALQDNILLQGHMYMFVHYICFYSNIFGYETKRIISFHEVTCVRKAKTAAIFPNAIEILAGSKKYFFASFLSRDEAFNLINDGFMRHGGSANGITDQQESQFDSQGDAVISNCAVNDFHSIERDEYGPIPEDFKLLPDVEDIVAEALSEVQGSAAGDVEAVSNSVSSSSSFRNVLWKQEDSDAPKIPECYSKVAESKFMIKVEDFFTLFFSDDAFNFFETYHQRCGDKDYTCTKWLPHKNFGHVRDVSFRHPIKFYFGAKFGSCQEVQKFRVFRNSHLVIETSQEIGDAPYGDYFRVEGLWDVVRDGKGSVEGSILTVYVNVLFSKKTMWKGKIEQATAEECREACSIWTSIAYELLKQRQVNIQEDDGSTSDVIPNGQVEAEMRENFQGPLENSHEEVDCTRISQVAPDCKDVKQGIGYSVQRIIMDASSLGSLLREFAARLCSSAKRKNNILVLLVITFAVIFLLMQLSIVVLLCRPQVHLISQAEFVHGMSSGIAEMSAETASWLENQIHHLKDEMLMVEVRLEKMWQEHSLLKAQLENLERLRRQR